MRKNKLLLLLALLMTAATGAWADETLLLTIESKDYTTFTSGSKTFDNKVTVTFSNSVKNPGSNLGWYTRESSLLTVAGTNGYTITSCKFYVEIGGTAKTGYTVEGESPSVYLFDNKVYTDANDEESIGSIGVTKIEVYGGAAASGYTVTLKDGVKDADKWTISPNPAEEGQTVTLQYTGRLKVKGVTATSEAAAPSVPDGAISGVFSVSDGKQVYFSKGNLRYASSKWSFFDNQYDYYTSYSADAWDHFGWSTSATTYGMSTSSNNDDYSGDFVDWGATMGAGWRTLTSDEWAYLLKTRSASTVNGTENGRYAKAKVNDVGGVILFPDTYTHPDGVAAPTGVNATDEYGWEGNSYTAADWTKMESAGCVFLPAAGCRYGSEMIGLGSYGYYGSATPDGADYAYRVKFNSGSLEPANSINRCLGCSVRLVQEATSEAAPAAGKTVDLSTLTADYVAQNGDVLTGETSSYEVTIAAGATVTLDGVTINGSSYCIKCAGDATIILKDGSTNTLTNTGGDYPALSIGDANTTLTIQGSTGVLNVSSGMYCAGIGGGYSNTNSTCGNIRIEGGVINAKGGDAGAGIGTDAGDATCGDIIITGGTITAKGGDNAAGIGSGACDIASLAVCGDITIANTVTKVTATAGENAPHSIGKGSGGKASCGTVTIGGTKYWENNAAVNGGDTYLAQSPLIYDPTAPAAKPAATVTTAPTGAEIVGVGKTTALVSGGVADGGTLMYAVTTTNTKPTSTAGFSDAVPTAKDITASGKVYVWYYVKGDDTHSDSEIAATAIEVPVAYIVVWDATNISDLRVRGTHYSYEKEGVTLSGNGDDLEARWKDKGDPTRDGIQFVAMESGGFTFTAPTGKAFTKIEMTLTGPAGWDNGGLGTGWAYNWDFNTNIITVTWTGSAASTVNLLTDADHFSGEYVKYIAFYLSE